MEKSRAQGGGGFAAFFFHVRMRLRSSDVSRLGCTLPPPSAISAVGRTGRCRPRMRVGDDRAAPVLLCRSRASSNDRGGPRGGGRGGIPPLPARRSPNSGRGLPPVGCDGDDRGGSSHGQSQKRRESEFSRAARQNRASCREGRNQGCSKRVAGTSGKSRRPWKLQKATSRRRLSPSKPRAAHRRRTNFPDDEEPRPLRPSRNRNGGRSKAKRFPTIG